MELILLSFLLIVALIGLAWVAWDWLRKGPYGTHNGD